ncbi:MAG: hypothetical protein U9N78_06540, partial [Actinomycetota bacterium]|nr:hypothetical protein [Actinomycetota bacterium]
RAELRVGAIAARALAGFEELANETRRSVDDDEHGAMHFRPTLERLVRGHQVALLLDAAQRQGPLATELAAAASLLTGRYLDLGYRPEQDPAFADTVEAVLGPDLVL